VNRQHCQNGHCHISPNYYDKYRQLMLIVIVTRPNNYNYINTGERVLNSTVLYSSTISEPSFIRPVTLYSPGLPSCTFSTCICIIHSVSCFTVHKAGHLSKYSGILARALHPSLAVTGHIIIIIKQELIIVTLHEVASHCP